MSFGFRVTSSLGNILVNESSSVYYVPRYTVSQTGKAIRPIMKGAQCYVDVIITFQHPINSIEQPYLYMTQDVPAGIPAGYDDWGQLQLAWTWKRGTANYGWMPNLEWTCGGVPGAWTNMVVRVGMMGSWYQANRENNYNPPDFRHVFVPVANGGSPPSGYGMCVFDASGRVVFNSNDNFVHITSASNSWTLYAQGEMTAHHLQYGDSLFYCRIFHNPAMPSSYDDLIRVIPRQTTRRRQGSLGYVGLYQINPRVERSFAFGRWDDDGVEAETPVIWVRPVQPRYYTAI